MAEHLLINYNTNTGDWLRQLQTYKMRLIFLKCFYRSSNLVRYSNIIYNISLINLSFIYVFITWHIVYNM